MGTSTLFALLEQDLGAPVKKSGAWMFWHCPFHDDRNASFALKDDRFYCFGCGAHGDAVDWLTEYRKMSKRDALQTVKGKLFARLPVGLPSVNKADLLCLAGETDNPPEDWQKRAWAFVEDCANRLWSEEGARALTYLRDRRGLKDETIRLFRLGFWSGGNAEGFGFVNRGITIPNYWAGVLFGVKLRHPAGEPKYTNLKGSRSRLYLCTTITPGRDDLVLCEGEFDALICHQEAGDVCAVGTLGGCSVMPGVIDLIAIMTSEKVILAYDADEAGQMGAQKIMKIIGERATLAPLPAGYKDITEAYLGGVDLYGWLEPYFSPLPVAFGC